jgi:hypothetical protein
VLGAVGFIAQQVMVEESMNLGRYFVQVCLERKVAGIVKVNFCV